MSAADTYIREELKLHVYLYLDCVRCSICGADRIEELSVFWDGITAFNAPREEGCMKFAERATKYLLEQGWTIRDELPCCPDCYSRLKKSFD